MSSWGVQPFMDPDVVQYRMEPGDLIEFDRGLYKHWAICISPSEITHITGSDAALTASMSGPEELRQITDVFNALFASSRPATSSTSMDKLYDDPDATKAIVECVKLREVADGSKVRIDNKMAAARERGLRARDPRAIVADCRRMKGRIVDYNLTFANCEHFATRLKYGTGWSDQVNTAVVAGGAVAAGVALGVGIYGLVSYFMGDKSKDDED